MHLGSGDGMLDAVMLLGAFGVIEAIQRTHEVAGDAADAVERLRAQIVIQFYLVAADLDVDMAGFMAELFGGTVDICLDLRLFQRSVSDGNSTSHSMTLLYITQSGTKYGYLDDE